MKKEIDTNGTIVAGMFIYDYADFNEANTRSNTTTIYTVRIKIFNKVKIFFELNLQKLLIYKL